MRKSRLELVRISAAVMGIEFCYAAETAYVSPTLLKIGISHAHMTLIWCLSPLIGFFLTPILGSLSDRCRSPMGRRRPFILALSVGIILGLLLVPNGKDIGMAMGDTLVEMPMNLSHADVVENVTKSEMMPSPLITNTMTTVGYHPRGIFFTVIGTVLLDFNADACQSPSRAYMLDVTVADDHATGLSTFTVMAGLGGSMGYSMGALNWESTSVGTFLGGHVRSLFTVIIFIYIVCVIVTVFSFREIPLDVLNLAGQSLENGDGSEHAAKMSNWADSGHRYQRFSDDIESDTEAIKDTVCLISDVTAVGTNISDDTTHCKTHYGATDAASSLETSFSKDGVEDDQYKNTLCVGVNSSGDSKDDSNNRMKITKIGDTQCAETNFKEQSSSTVTLEHYLLSILNIPNSMKILCLTNMFSWMSIVSYSLYFTDFVGEAVFGGDPSATDGSPSRQLYENGVRFGCWGMAVYSLSCALYSFVIDRLILIFNAKPVYIGGQLIYSFGMAILALSRHKSAVIILSCTTGVMYATVFTMPYLLVAHYHTNNVFDIPCVGTGDIGGQNRNHVRGIGTDVAIVSSMLFLAQFTLSACMGTIVNLTGSTVSVVILAAALSLCGAVSATQVQYFSL